VLALGTEIEPFNVKALLSPLQASHIGIIRSPVTLVFITCAPNVGAFEHP
jgi:hypothetical protein